MPTDETVLFEPVGCPKCGHTGYRGRCGIFELVVVDEQMRSLIHDGASEQNMESHARGRTPSIQYDGRRKVLQGMTSLEEVLRVSRES